MKKRLRQELCNFLKTTLLYLLQKQKNMKKLTLILVAFCFMMALLIACQTTDPTTEKANVEAAIIGFYDAVEAFNYGAIPTFVTSDFGAYEEGFTYSDIDGFVNTLRSFEGAKSDISLDFVKTEVSGDMAFSIVKFDAKISVGAHKQ